MASIRRCRDDEREAVFAIVNNAAEAYRGVIPADRWHEPYMPMSELDEEIAAASSRPSQSGLLVPPRALQ